MSIIAEYISETAKENPDVLVIIAAGVLAGFCLVGEIAGLFTR